MSDLLTDARETLADISSRRPGRTHYAGCRTEHVGCLLADLIGEVERLRLAILRLADQDATLSVCEGDVTVRSRRPQNAKDQEHRMTDETTPQDGKAMSPASAGSVDRALQPAVWAILSENGQYRLPEIADGVKVCRFYSNDRYVPLYAEEAMKRVASVEWIQVSERLPEDGTWCWVDWDGPGKPFPAMRDSRSAGGWTNTDGWEDFGRVVTRWMSLPEPPTGASDTEHAGSTAADEIERLRAEVAVLKESAAKLHDIAASGAEPTTRRRMLDQMAMESFAEYG